MAKKSKNYTPYIFAILLTIITQVTQKLFLQPFSWSRNLYIFTFYFCIWHYVEWLLTLSEKKWLQWIYVFIGINMYNFTWIGLDYYFFHFITNLEDGQPWDIAKSLFVTAICPVFIIESIKAREKAQIENLRLQAENIETKFQLLKEQVNPEFLFYCLTNLKKMVNSKDPNTEDYILKLADVYRQILKKERNLVSLKEDLTILKTYLFLMSYGREATI